MLHSHHDLHDISFVYMQLLKEVKLFTHLVSVVLPWQ